MADAERIVPEVELDLAVQVEHRAQLRELREKVKHDLFAAPEDQAENLAKVDASIAQCGTRIEELMDERAEAEMIEAHLSALDHLLDGEPSS